LSHEFAATRADSPRPCPLLGVFATLPGESRRFLVALTARRADRAPPLRETETQS